jgi:agmatine deiminase
MGTTGKLDAGEGAPRTMTDHRTPGQDGLEMPPAWAAHDRCFMAWPCRAESWGGEEAMAYARDAIAAAARAIARFEPVTMLAAPPLVAGASLACGASVAVMPMPMNDSFARDVGPTFVMGKAGVAGVAWGYDGYGEVGTEGADDDRAFAGRLLEELGMRRYAGPMVLEGGAILVDGEGTLITSESVLLDERRNGGRDRKDVEAVLAEQLGVHRVVWLAGGLENDGTRGHVSLVAAIAAPGVVLALATTDHNDVNYPMLNENIERLRKATDARGRVFDIVPVQQPSPHRHDGRRLPLSYVNFHVANGAVILPTFDDPLDEQASQVVKAAFPEREVVRLPALDLFASGVGLTAVTLPLPAGAILPPAPTAET